MRIQECGSNENGKDQKEKKKKVFSSKISTNSGFHLKILAIFHESYSKDQKRKVFSSKMSTNFCGHLAIFHEFYSEDQKKRSSSPKFHEIRCESTKTTKKQFLLANTRTISTNLGVLGLDLHSSSPEPGNFFRAQSLLGEAQAVICWGHGHVMPPRGAGPALMGARGWF